jgi:hypothetical protein
MRNIFDYNNTTFPLVANFLLIKELPIKERQKSLNMIFPENSRDFIIAKASEDIK